MEVIFKLLILLLSVYVAGVHGEPWGWIFDQQEHYRGHHIISVQAKTTEQLEILQQLEDNENYMLDFWSQPSLLRPTDIRVPPEIVKTIATFLGRKGFQLKVLHTDLQRLIEEEKGESVTGYSYSEFDGKDIESEYLTFNEIQRFLTNLSTEHPERVEMTSLGKTYEGRDIIKIKISANLNATDRPAVWIEAMTHAREWITGAATLYTIRRLAKQSDPEAEAMLTRFDWHVVPVHNPDGYVYSHTNDRLWRKNRKPSKAKRCWFFCKICYGTDLNRNWNINWGGKGASSNRCSPTFKGKKAFSELETQALSNAVSSTPNSKAFFSVHAYSQMILIPDGFSNKKPSDYATLKHVADRASLAMYNIHGKHYLTGTSGDLLYLASGCSEDYMRKSNGPAIKWSYGYELRPGLESMKGFLLHKKWILPTSEELFASFHSFAMDIINLS